MYKSRDEILALCKRRYAVIDGIRIQSLSELEMSTLRGLWAKRASEIDEADIEAQHRHLTHGQSELLAMVIVDDSGARVFGNDSIDQIGQLDYALFEKLYDAAAEHTGISAKTEEEVDKLEKKSESTVG